MQFEGMNGELLIVPETEEESKSIEQFLRISHLNTTHSKKFTIEIDRTVSIKIDGKDITS